MLVATGTVASASMLHSGSISIILCESCFAVWRENKKWFVLLLMYNSIIILILLLSLLLMH